MMNPFTEDIWTIILARLPIKSITTSKLVCKQWKSIVESPFLRELFLSHHQNSHSSWSLMLQNHSLKEVVAHYGCRIWGLPRSLGSYVSSFITANFDKQKVRVLAYTDVGLILVSVTYIPCNRTYYVANPVSRQCMRIPPLPKPLVAYRPERAFRHAGLVTRTENGVVLGYKVLILQSSDYKGNEYLFTFIIYSSETGLWSSNYLQYSIHISHLQFAHPICLNGSLYWLGRNLDGQEVVVSIDFYGSSDQRYRVIPFPDSGKKQNFKRSCTTSQGNLMYMNIVSEDKDDGGVPEHKLSVWRLKTCEWQLVSEISRGFISNGLDYFPLLVNPFDGNTMYMWSEMYESLASINLRNGKSRVHNKLERSRNGQSLCSVGCKRKMDTIGFLSRSYFSMFVLPRWLYQIPCTSEVAERNPNSFWLLSNDST